MGSKDSARAKGYNLQNKGKKQGYREGAPSPLNENRKKSVKEGRKEVQEDSVDKENTRRAGQNEEPVMCKNLLPVVLFLFHDGEIQVSR